MMKSNTSASQTKRLLSALALFGVLLAGCGFRPRVGELGTESQSVKVGDATSVRVRASSAPVLSWLPLISTGVSCIIFIAAAIRRFNHQEF